jgi:hypothetical protein
MTESQPTTVTLRDVIERVLRLPEERLSEAAAVLDDVLGDTPNAETRRVLDDVAAGRDLTIHKDADELFEKLGLPH